MKKQRIWSKVTKAVAMFGILVFGLSLTTTLIAGYVGYNYVNCVDAQRGDCNPMNVITDPINSVRLRTIQLLQTDKERKQIGELQEVVEELAKTNSELSSELAEAKVELILAKDQLANAIVPETSYGNAIVKRSKAMASSVAEGTVSLYHRSVEFVSKLWN